MQEQAKMLKVFVIVIGLLFPIYIGCGRSMFSESAPIPRSDLQSNQQVCTPQIYIFLFRKRDFTKFYLQLEYDCFWVSQDNDKPRLVCIPKLSELDVIRMQ